MNFIEDNIQIVNIGKKTVPYPAVSAGYGTVLFKIHKKRCGNYTPMRAYSLAKAAVIVYNVDVHWVNKVWEQVFLLLASVLSKPKQGGAGHLPLIRKGSV